ncbi:unnamed protein product [Rhizophagus irregularis]|nr:unnamed protein product [Rhizophagus irregularis]
MKQKVTLTNEVNGLFTELSKFNWYGLFFHFKKGAYLQITSQALKSKDRKGGDTVKKRQKDRNIIIFDKRSTEDKAFIEFC